MGIRKKITIGFLILAMLLVFSGIVSFFQLSRIGAETQNILRLSQRNMELAREMLDAAEEQNFALLQMFMGENLDYDTLFMEGKERFAIALDNARAEGFTGLDSIAAAYQRYEESAKYYVLHSIEGDTEWFIDEYGTNYHRLTDAVKAYMTSSQNSLAPQALVIEKNAYRAITPSIITIGVMLLVVLMFLYFIDLYYVQPVVKINRSLGDYLSFNTPFNVQMEGKDETFELKEKIEELIAQLKSCLSRNTQ